MWEEILGWVSILISPEGAILAWRAGDKSLFFIIAIVLPVSSIGLVIFYGTLVGVCRVFEKVFRINAWQEKCAGRLSGILKNKFGCIILLLINSIPVPYLTTISLVAVGLAKIKNGFVWVLIGNTLKITVAAPLIIRTLKL